MQTVDVTRYIIGVLVLLAILVMAVMALSPKIKGKLPDLKWVKEIRIVKIIVIGFILIIGILTVREFLPEEWKIFREFWDKHQSYCWLASTGLACLIVWVSLQKSAPAHATTSGGHGGHGGHEGGGWLWIVILVFFFGFGLVWPAIQTIFGLGQGVPAVATATPSGPINSGPWVSVTATPDVWTPVVVGKGMYAHWTIDGPGHILYRFNNSPEVEDWSGQQVVTSAPHGPYTAFFKAKGTNSVSLKVYLR